MIVLVKSHHVVPILSSFVAVNVVCVVPHCCVCHVMVALASLLLYPRFAFEVHEL